MLRAGRRCLQQAGPRALRMHAVAREAGCCRATLYRYFARKEDLLAALAVERAALVFEETMARAGHSPDLGDRLARMLASALEIVSELPELMHSRSASEERETDRLMIGSPTIRSAVASFVSPLLDEAERAGVLREGVTPHNAAEWLILVAVGLIDTSWAGGRTAERSKAERVAFLRRFVASSIFRDA